MKTAKQENHVIMQTSTGESSPDQPPSCTHTSAHLTLLDPVCPSASPPSQAERWQDWRWQLRNRIRTPEALRKFFPDISQIDALSEASALFPMAVTPYYASLIQNLDASDPIFRMSIPQLDELIPCPHLKEDPLDEDKDSPVPGLIHRYVDRALILATSTCSVYCRHCTRKRVAGQRESCLTRPQLKLMIGYLREHPEVKDVIISGGDPFTMPTRSLETILAALRSVPSVEIIRIGTRTPVVLPMRITNELVSMLRRYHPIYINTHFNHPVELTPEAARACTTLADAGVPVGNQTVLLRGVNDDAMLLAELFRGLVKNRVRPYYLFQCDLVRGVEHFRTKVSKGIEIMEYLRGRLSGLAIPNFVVDVPGGGGKIPLLPSYILASSPTHTVLRNFEGMIVAYPEPAYETVAAPQRSQKPVGGVWDVTVGNVSAIGPTLSKRLVRRTTGRGSPLSVP